MVRAATAGCSYPHANSTHDHGLPIAKGGRDKATNGVTQWAECNAHTASHTPQHAAIPQIIPSIHPIGSRKLFASIALFAPLRWHVSADKLDVIGRVWQRFRRDHPSEQPSSSSLDDLFALLLT